jgi:hypothetical protein
MKTQNFKQWMKDTYDREELETIAQHGCQSGVGGMIYYSETCALYDKHAEEMHDMIYEYKENFGDFPQYIIEELGCFTGFKNAVVWLCAEMIAQEMTNEEETEE